MLPVSPGGAGVWGAGHPNPCGQCTRSLLFLGLDSWLHLTARLHGRSRSSSVGVPSSQLFLLLLPLLGLDPGSSDSSQVCS